jgi:hypothetical protein
MTPMNSIVHWDGERKATNLKLLPIKKGPLCSDPSRQLSQAVPAILLRSQIDVNIIG